MSKKKRQDPHFQREKEKYEFPIPSRELILDLLEKHGRPISKSKLLTLLEVNEQETTALGYRLKAMIRDGQIMQDRRGRFCLVGRIHLVRGKVQGHPDGFGFFVPDDGSEDMVISPKEMRCLMHGDHVLAYQSGFDRRGRPEAAIREIIEHANHHIVGRFFIEYDVGYLIPDNKRLTQDITIPLAMAMNAQSGQIVLAEIVAFPTKRNQAIGKIIEVLGEHMAPGMEINVAIHAHGIPNEWPQAVVKEAGKIPQQVHEEDCKGRTDLRHLSFVTIDGEDARDFDDAVYCEMKSNGGYQLYVAIADVSHYVKPGSALDQEAARRGNSVYFPAQVIPMLPMSLSHGICSLNPHEDRLCMVAEMSFSAEGKMTRSRFYRGVFHSKARLTYTQVATWIEQKIKPKEHEAIWPSLQALFELFNLLHQTRLQRGAIEFETTETSIEFDEMRKIQRVKPVFRNIAHRMIEECMLAANTAVAKHLKKSKIPMLFRIHEPPVPEKLQALREFLGEFALTLDGGKKPQPLHFQKTLAAAAKRPEKHIIETVMLRSLKQAVYAEHNEGHFGLAYPIYTHFTSPIRRYPDLLIHRALGHLIDNRSIDRFIYSDDEMAQQGKHCSVTERRADEAVREVVSWLKCEYMQDKLGQVFQGKITGVTGFGIFVELDEIFVEGLVHVTSLRNDYYTFDASKHRLVGQRLGQAYRLGDKLTVQVARVDLDERKIDFELVAGKADNE